MAATFGRQVRRGRALLCIRLATMKRLQCGESGFERLVEVRDVQTVHERVVAEHRERQKRAAIPVEGPSPADAGVGIRRTGNRLNEGGVAEPGQGGDEQARERVLCLRQPMFLPAKRLGLTGGGSGASRSRQPWTQADDDELVRMYPDWTEQQLARHFGRSAYAIHCRLIRLGVIANDLTSSSTKGD